jgi:hypothetical protein
VVPPIETEGGCENSRKNARIFAQEKVCVAASIVNKLKSFTMHRVDIFSFLASDAAELTKMQTRLNQWMTAKSLVKYEIHTAGEYIIFNVCRKKEEA